MVILRCCFAEDGKEINTVLRRTCWAIVLLIKSFVQPVLVAVAINFSSRSLGIKKLLKQDEVERFFSVRHDVQNTYTEFRSLKPKLSDPLANDMNSRYCQGKIIERTNLCTCWTRRHEHSCSYQHSDLPSQWWWPCALPHDIALTPCKAGISTLLPRVGKNSKGIMLVFMYLLRKREYILFLRECSQLEQFSVEFRKIKIKAITTTNRSEDEHHR